MKKKGRLTRASARDNGRLPFHRERGDIFRRGCHCCDYSCNSAEFPELLVTPLVPVEAQD